MATYSIHLKAGSAPDDVTLVPEGFNARAFIFTALWALWNRLWVVAAIVFAVLVSVTLLASVLGFAPEIIALLQFGLSLLFGFEANDLRRMSLSRSGYREVAVVSGGSLVEAELRYFAGRPRLGGATVSDAAPFRFDHDTLGLFGNV